MEIKVGSKRNLFLARYGDIDQLRQSLADEDHEVRIAALSNSFADEVNYKIALKDVDVRVRQAAEKLLASSNKTN